MWATLQVDVFGRHALSCRSSEGTWGVERNHPQDIILSAHVPSRLEPVGLLRSDGKRPDGVTIVPWTCGKLLVWDATCPDTFAPSYASHAAIGAGEVAAQAEARKSSKYAGLPVTHSFVPVAIETLGAIGPHSLVFLRELGRRVRRQMGNIFATSSLLQKLSVAVQRGNAACLSYKGDSGVVLDLHLIL